MSFAPPVLAAIGAGVQVAGSIANMRQGMRQEAYNAAVAKRNAALAEQNAKREEENAIEEMNASQVEGQEWSISAAEQIGQLVAARSASNTLMLGSNANRVEGLRELAFRDQLRIRQSGYSRYKERMVLAGDIRAQGEQYQAAEAIAGQRRRAEMWGGLMNIGSSVIGGAQAIQQARA